MKMLTLSLMLSCTLWAAAAAGDSEDIEVDDDIDALLLAGSCYGCHATTTGQQGAMADLSQLSVEEVSARLKDYQQRNRQATVMSRIASGYSDGEIEQLANYFGRASP